jgi:GMP synthase-like glutamine amidotransferase
MTTCLVIQHVEPESPYAIGDALERAGISVFVCRTYTGANVPNSLAGFDGLVVMGGPMSATDDAGFPTRRAEINLATEALGRGIPTLGVCLGAQVLALAAGGEVFKGLNGPEVGWGEIELSELAGADQLFAGLPPQLTVLQWHGDTFTLPPDGVNLARSAHYHEQAFRCGSAAWGLQFHVEVDEIAVEAFLDSFGADAFEAGTNPDAIRAETASALARLRPHRDLILERFALAVARPHQGVLATS